MMQEQGDDPMRRGRTSGGTPGPVPAPPWLVGAMIGMTILTMATGAMAAGAGMATGMALGSGAKPK